MKLLDARAKIEREVAAGGSTDIARRIREAMADVQKAFRKQLEALDEFRFINLESEMDALSSMLKSEGLTAQEDYAPELCDTKEEAEDLFAGLFTQGGK